jgi:hypothetical protein
MLTEGALGDHRRRQLDNGGGRPPCRVGGLRRGAPPSNISWALEDTEAANLSENSIPVVTPVNKGKRDMKRHVGATA